MPSRVDSNVNNLDADGLGAEQQIKDGIGVQFAIAPDVESPRKPKTVRADGFIDRYQTGCQCAPIG
jgi:hypothetical protein